MALYLALLSCSYFAGLQVHVERGLLQRKVHYNFFCFHVPFSTCSSRCQSPSHTKTLPPRPPPPKAPPRQSSLDVGDRPSSVSPPGSPMRRRSIDHKIAERPKPPTRRRKKFNTPDNIAEEEDSRGEPSNQNESLDVAEETWEVIPPGIKISDEDLRNSTVKHSSPVIVAVDEVEGHPQGTTVGVKGQVEAPPTVNNTAPNGDLLSNDNFEQAVRALSVKKKKPPPLRPIPYSEKIPPLPPKKKKTVHIYAEPETFPAEDECNYSDHDDDDVVGGHLYETIDRSNLK